jgi:Zn finger protein HypA/HybF involved in hydrogenase expression
MRDKQIDYDILDSCIKRLNKLAQAFDTPGMGTVRNELADISYNVRAIVDAIRAEIDEYSCTDCGWSGGPDDIIINVQGWDTCPECDSENVELKNERRL